MTSNDFDIETGSADRKSSHHGSKIGTKISFMPSKDMATDDDDDEDDDVSFSSTSRSSSRYPRAAGAESDGNTTNGIRCTIILILMLGVCTAVAFLWMGISNEQEKNQGEFHRSAADAASKIHTSFEDYVTATSMVHNRCRHRNFTRQDFREVYEYLVESGLQFKSVQFDPNITHAERESAEAEARAYYAENYPHVNYQGIRGFNTLDSKTLEPRTDQPFYFPIHYQEPIAGNEAAIDLDYYSSESRIRAVNAVFETKGPSLTDRLSLVKKAGEVSRCGNHDGPSYGVVLMHPGVELSDPKESDAVWPRDFSSIVLCVPDLLRRSTLDQTKSSLVYIHDRSHPSGEPVFLGGADVFVDTGVDNGEGRPDISFLDEVSLSSLDAKFIEQRNVTAANRVWTVTVLATEESYKSENLFIWLGGALILLGSSLMALWVYTNARRQIQYKHVLQKAERSNAIVTSLFPGNTARKMMEELDRERNAANSDGASVAGTIAGYDANERGTQAVKITKRSKPIADLFPETTIMFADMEGFTAWSSMRDPISVFHLLETIYSAFDNIADKLGVFKVETVGDCYVAVCGLPEPREDHAVVMARFATGCCNRLARITSKLEVKLGPSTAQLGFRFGLHSGPVTGGVLRGQRARFQLFGDTVNTAARIEATGIKGRVHLSNTTAALLQKAGKGDWVVPRDEKVLAKGIGMIKTCWLDIDGKSMPEQASRSLDRTQTTWPDVSEREESTCESEESFDKHSNLVNWHTEMLASFLKVLVAQQQIEKTPEFSKISLDALEWAINEEADTPIEKLNGNLHFPEVKNLEKTLQLAEEVDLDDLVMQQLRNFVRCVASLYNNNPFHSFEHASHVVMSVVKLLSSMELNNQNNDTLNDPLARFTLVLASVVHDVDHYGVPNDTLVTEQAGVAIQYKGKSVAEQNSLDICWDLLMLDEHKELRRTIYKNDSDLARFREYLVHAVLVTDIVNKELQTKRKERWNKVFGAAPGSDPSADDAVVYESESQRLDTRKTALLELVIQASDVSHTMQHWHIFRQYNTYLYKENFQAYKAGRAANNPTDGWYNGEIGFFKFYVIPLAERVKQSRACGALGEELFQYACSNLDEWQMKGQGIVDTLRGSAPEYEKDLSTPRKSGEERSRALILKKLKRARE